MSTTMTSQIQQAEKLRLPRATYGLLAILILIAVAGFTTPSFATFDNLFVVVRAPR